MRSEPQGTAVRQVNSRCWECQVVQLLSENSRSYSSSQIAAGAFSQGTNRCLVPGPGEGAVGGRSQEHGAAP